MLPKTHVFYGALLSLSTWFLFPDFTWFPVLLLFFSSVLIDTDHYIWYVVTKKDWNLKNAYYYLKYEASESHQLMLFHTVEFLIFTGLLSFIWFGFYYILIGMLYHSALDIFNMTKQKQLFAREFSLIKWYIRKKKII